MGGVQNGNKLALYSRSLQWRLKRMQYGWRVAKVLLSWSPQARPGASAPRRGDGSLGLLEWRRPSGCRSLRTSACDGLPPPALCFRAEALTTTTTHHSSTRTDTIGPGQLFAAAPIEIFSQTMARDNEATVHWAPAHHGSLATRWRTSTQKPRPRDAPPAMTTYSTSTGGRPASPT